MDPISLLGGLGGFFGGILGNDAANQQQQLANQQSQAAFQYLQSVGIPPIDAQQIILQNPQFVSQFTPSQETAEQMGPSAMQGVSTDPRLAQAQMQALQSLQEQGQNPLTDMEKASLNSSRRQSSGDEQARQNAILQSMEARGMGGSGAELAARLSSSQAAAQKASEESDRQKADAQNRALQAIANAGTLAGSQRTQAFGEGAQKATAADAIAQFNAANRQGVQQRNISSQNAEALREAQMKQDLENQRAGNLNAQNLYNKQLLQQQYQNQLAKGNALMSSGGQAAKQNQAGAAGTAQNYTNIGAGAGKGVGGLLGALMKPSGPEAMPTGNPMSDEDKKKLADYQMSGQ